MPSCRAATADVIVYRVFARDPKAKPGQPGHHTYLHHPQGKGRIDNPHMYDAWYFAEKPEAAVGEVRGDVSVWSDEMFETPFLPGGRYALGRFRLPDNVALLDLDHASHLAERNLRPSEVVSRVRNTTQGWAASIFQEAQHDGSRKWAEREVVVVPASPMGGVLPVGSTRRSARPRVRRLRPVVRDGRCGHRCRGRAYPPIPLGVGCSLVRRAWPPGTAGSSRRR